MGPTTEYWSDTADRRVELSVRALSSRTGGGIQERALDLLERLERAGAVESVGVHVWGERVGLSTTAVETDCGQRVLDRIGRFREWANRNRVSLEPFFESRVTTSRITGEEYTTLHLPIIVLAEYENGDVVHVTPHEDDGSVTTVQDRLEHLERETFEAQRSGTDTLQMETR